MKGLGRNDGADGRRLRSCALIFFMPLDDSWNVEKSAYSREMNNC